MNTDKPKPIDLGGLVRAHIKKSEHSKQTSVLRLRNNVCPVCTMERANNGECDCDE